MKTAGLFFFVAGLALVAAGVVLGEEPPREVVRSVPERVNAFRQSGPDFRREAVNAAPVRKNVVQSGTARPLRD